MKLEFIIPLLVLTTLPTFMVMELETWGLYLPFQSMRIIHLPLFQVGSIFINLVN